MHSKYLEGIVPDLKEGLEKAMAEIEEKGLDVLMPYKVGNLAKPRIFEIAGAVNRLRSLQDKTEIESGQPQLLAFSEATVT